MKDKHVHEYKPLTKKVTLREGKAVDTLKQLVCKCGAVTTLDLTREVK